jgi:hypothetical protein
MVRAALSPTAALLLLLVASLLAISLMLHCCCALVLMSDNITMAAACWSWCLSHQCQPTLPRHCPDTAPTLPRHCPDTAPTLPRHCSTLRHSDTAGLKYDLELSKSCSNICQTTGQPYTAPCASGANRLLETTTARNLPWAPGTRNFPRRASATPLPCPPRTPRSGPCARPALLAHPLGSGARERLHWQLPSR